MVFLRFRATVVRCVNIDSKYHVPLDVVIRLNHHTEGRAVTFSAQCCVGVSARF
jgi:hypothetical protein